MCSIVDSFGNVALSVSSGEVVATLRDNATFFLLGFNRVAMRHGRPSLSLSLALALLFPLSLSLSLSL